MSLKRADRTLQTLWRSAVEELPQKPEEMSLLENGGQEYVQPYHGVHAEHTEIEMQPPRLEASSGHFCAACFRARPILIAIAVIYVLSTFSMQSLMPVQYYTLNHPWLLEYLSTDDAPPRPVPAVIKRLRLLKHATAPFHGADRQSLKSAFPHWFRNDRPDFENFFYDASLALHIISTQIDESRIDLKKRELTENKTAHAAL
jgi:hypothetical protein